MNPKTEIASGSKEEVIRAIEPLVKETLGLLKPVEECWQPSDLIPPLDTDEGREKIRELQACSKNISDECLMVLVGNMITEEALPSYETWANGLDGIGRKSGTSDNPWALWTRGWTAEENRHGQLIYLYLYLSSRVNLKAIERTIQYLIRNGFDPLTGSDPYYGLVYTSFQERATNIAHRNTGRVALKQGDPILAKMCSVIAGDETRHAQAYQSFFKEVLRLDPNGALVAFAEMMRRKIIMPAKNMAAGAEKDLFILHIVGAQRLGIYTATDYADIIRWLVERWEIAKLTSLSPAASEAQEYLCGLADTFYKRAGHLSMLAKMRPKMKCPWLFDRKI